MLLAFGDTHGSQWALGAIAEIIFKEQPELVVHTGDSYRDFLWLKKHTKARGYGVRGNCDFGFLPGVKDEVIFDYKNKKVLLVHGHRYGVKSTKDIILNWAKGKADVVIFGHTHVQYVQKHHDIWLVNPGSICLPRGGSKPGHAKVYIDSAGIRAELIQD